MARALPLAVLFFAVFATPTHAAEITLQGQNAHGIPVVRVSGDFVARDIERFADVTKHLDRAIISFSSNGGKLSAGIEIGTRIRFRGYRTVVSDREECYSACALAWLGGSVRYVGREARIGFHAAYAHRNGRAQEIGVGNAIVGAYAANLGLRTPAIIFLTSAPPEGFNYLTEERARQLRILAEFVDAQNLIAVRPAVSNSPTLSNRVSFDDAMSPAASPGRAPPISEGNPFADLVPRSPSAPLPRGPRLVGDPWRVDRSPTPAPRWTDLALLPPRRPSDLPPPAAPGIDPFFDLVPPGAQPPGGAGVRR